MKQLFTGTSKKKTDIKREESMKHLAPTTRDYDFKNKYTEHKGNAKVIMSLFKNLTI